MNPLQVADCRARTAQPRNQTAQISDRVRLLFYTIRRCWPSRIIQGIMTGVGFLGAGVIIRNSKGHHVHGLTTAACVWVTACIGAACAVAEWQIVVVGAFLVLVILVFGGPFEKAIDRRWPGRGPTDPGQTRSTTRVPSSEA